MDVFEVREQLVSDYRSFTAAFVEPRDPRIREFLEQQLAEGAQGPDPWLSRREIAASEGNCHTLNRYWLLSGRRDTRPASVPPGLFNHREGR